MKTVILKVQVPDGFHLGTYVDIYPDNMEGYFSHHCKLEIVQPPTNKEIDEIAQEQGVKFGFEGVSASTLTSLKLRSQIFGDNV